MNKVNYYTLIGSRDTPEHIMDILKQVVTKLDKLGWHARSGGANGADSCCNHVEHKEIYLPWDNFNGHNKNWEEGFIVYSDLNHVIECETYCQVHHQYWHNVKKESVKHLHRRNMHQVLGKDLKTPSKFCILYAAHDKERGEGHVKGGTGSANSLCLASGIEVHNLFYKKEVDKMIRFLLGNK